MRLLTFLLAGLALTLLTVASTYLLLADTSTGSSCTFPGGCTSYSKTLVEDQGPGMLVLLAAPLLLGGFVVWGMATQETKTFELPLAALLLFFCFVSIFSIGAFYFLGALVLLLATIADRRPRNLE